MQKTCLDCGADLTEDHGPKDCLNTVFDKLEKVEQQRDEAIELLLDISKKVKTYMEKVGAR